MPQRSPTVTATVRCLDEKVLTLAQTAALRAVGGFDADAAHFDDWSTWLRLADRNVAIWCVPEVVAEWRIHDRGLSAQVIQLRAMKSRLLALFDRLHAELSDENARGIAIARRTVAAADVNTYDDYVRLMAATRRALHADGQCLGRRLHRAIPLSPPRGERAGVRGR